MDRNGSNFVRIGLDRVVLLLQSKTLSPIFTIAVKINGLCSSSYFTIFYSWCSVSISDHLDFENLIKPGQFQLKYCILHAYINPYSAYNTTQMYIIIGPYRTLSQEN